MHFGAILYAHSPNRGHKNRALQMQEEGGEQLDSYVSYKPVGKALEEVAAGKLRKVKQDASTVYEDEI